MPGASFPMAAATPDNCGIVSDHIQAIRRVCKRENSFLLIRPSTTATMRLISAGFSTKSMDVHDKSSDWGLTSGFVPCDQAFSKNQKPAMPNPDIHPHAHGQAAPVHLTFSAEQLGQLLVANHFGVDLKEIKMASATASSDDLKKYRIFESSRNTEVQFLWQSATKQVWWRWKNKSPNPPVKVWAWGYKGVAVTGDYDIWMAAPQVKNVRGQNSIQSVKDSHGRSAAPRFVCDLIQALNAECGRVANPVFNHGAEAQNYSFTQGMDRTLAVFCPGIIDPFILSRTFLKSCLHDMLRHGYVVVRNSKWLNGTTLGIEDMAFASEQFPDDPMVKVGVSEHNKLKEAAATKLQRALRAKKSGTDPLKAEGPQAWKDRYSQLRQFRNLANMPSSQDIDLLLPPEAFPSWGPGSKADTDGEADALAKDIESRFGRTGFVKDGDHVVPVDATGDSVPKVDVGQKIAMWKKLIGEL